MSLLICFSLWEKLSRGYARLMRENLSWLVVLPHPTR
jgi:hypothetical protein